MVTGAKPGLVFPANRLVPEPLDLAQAEILSSPRS